MSSWFSLSAHGGAPPGIDPVRYGLGMGVVAAHVADRVNRNFAGRLWLRRHCPSRDYLRVHLLPRDTASTEVEYLRKKNGELLCGLRIPVAWFAEPSDALLGLRQFQASLHAMRTIGDRFGIGLPDAIGPAADRRDPELQDPFVEPVRKPLRYADTAVAIEHRANSLRPDHLLIAGKKPGGRQRSLAEALGSVAEQHRLGPADAEVTAWIVQIPE